MRRPCSPRRTWDCRRHTFHRYRQGRRPGNVRELENTVERAVILATGDLVTEGELPPALRAMPTNAAGDTALAMPDGENTLEAIERRAIAQALEATGNNKSEAARRLGITRATLHNKLQKYQ